MNDQFERYVNTMFGFFGRCNKWFLLDRCLAYFACNGTFDGYRGEFDVGVLNMSVKQFLDAIAMYRMDFKQTGAKSFRIYNQFGAANAHLFHLDNGVWKHPAGSIPGHMMLAPKQFEDRTIRLQQWEYQIDEQHPYTLRLPFKYGSVLDIRFPLWWKKIKHNPEKVTHQDGEFLAGKRKQNAIELLRKMHECAADAAISDAIWPGFGTLLGIVMINDFLPNDHDMDMCFQTDTITKNQESDYLQECERAGLFKARRRGPTLRYDTGRYLWMSLGEKDPYKNQGCKSCNWFCFEHNGYLWHTKGGMWVSQKKFDKLQFNYTKNDQAVCKGLPAKFFGDWVKQDFHGVEINVPKLAGHCCDYWYPGWFFRKRGHTSRKKTVMIIGNWRNKKSWRLV